MSNFYDGWLGFWDDEQKERAEARKFIHEEELEWVRTKQDYRAALTVARENGFITAGAQMIGEIPAGWHTGKHSHGEEGIFILDGEGFTILDGKRYDWDTGSCLFMPYGLVHQHFNSGHRTVRYLSVLQLALERFASLAKVVQYEEVGEIHIFNMEGVEKAESDIHPKHGRIVLRGKNATVTFRSDDLKRVGAKDEIEYIKMRTEAEKAGRSIERISTHRNRYVHLMARDSAFNNKEITLSSLFGDNPGQATGKHSHEEAVLYVLQGEGYAIVDGARIEWKKGTTYHVQGPRTVHQHFNTGKIESVMLRINYGLREYFDKIIVPTHDNFEEEAISM